MHWLIASIATIGAVEIMLRLPVSTVISRWQRMARQVIRVITSRNISDHWKEIVLPLYAFRLFRLTVQLALLVAIAVLPFALAVAVSALAQVPLLGFLSSLTGVAVTTVVALSYFSVRTSGVRPGL